MDFPHLRTHFDAEAERLVAAARADGTAPVPSCPDWSLDDLLWHVAEVYGHKVACMRDGDPKDWPPARVAIDPRDLLGRALVDLRAEFDQRDPADASFTWCGWDQTVGFWIRRMAHETVIHRVDAELAAGSPISPVDADLAVDGIDEVLGVFLPWDSQQASDELAEILPRLLPASVAVRAGGRQWVMSGTPAGIVTSSDSVPEPAATVSGDPESVLLWLWRNRCCCGCGGIGAVVAVAARASLRSQRYRGGRPQRREEVPRSGC